MGPRRLFGGRLSGIGSALLALVILLYQAAYGALTLGGFFALAETIVRFQGTLFQMLRQMGDVFEQVLYIRDLRSFVESPTEQGAGGEALPEQPLDIAVEGVGFAYGDGPPVLNGVELRLRPGKKLALVGANGAGKTTLVKLLLAVSAGRGAGALQRSRWTPHQPRGPAAVLCSRLPRLCAVSAHGAGEYRLWAGRGTRRSSEPTRT